MRKYKFDYKLIERLASVGLTDAEISIVIGMVYVTFTDTKSKDEKLQKALESGKQVPNRKVEEALYRRALGYETRETTLEENRPVKVVIKQLPPDVRAIEIWLRNRMPERWNTPQTFNANLTMRDLSDIAKMKG